MQPSVVVISPDLCDGFAGLDVDWVARGYRIGASPVRSW